MDAPLILHAMIITIGLSTTGVPWTGTVCADVWERLLSAWIRRNATIITRAPRIHVSASPATTHVCKGLCAMMATLIPLATSAHGSKVQHLRVYVKEGSSAQKTTIAMTRTHALLTDAKTGTAITNAMLGKDARAIGSRLFRDIV
jgi:hypothetical protein